MDAPDAMGGAAVHPDEAMADSQKVANQEELRLQRFRAWMQVSLPFLLAWLGFVVDVQRRLRRCSRTWWL